MRKKAKGKEKENKERGISHTAFLCTMTKTTKKANGET